MYVYEFCATNTETYVLITHNNNNVSIHVFAKRMRAQSPNESFYDQQN